MAAAVLACGRPATPTVQREGEPVVMGIAESDPRMRAAIAAARASLDSFIERLESPPPTQRAASIKAAFPTEAGAEHIWLDEPSFSNGRFSALVGNVPVNLPGLELGDRVQVARADVSDWLIIDGNCLLGGYTIRAIRDSLGPAEREAFDRELPIPLCP